MYAATGTSSPVTVSTRRGRNGARSEAREWAGELAQVIWLDGDQAGLTTQAQIIKEINDAAGETGVVVCAAGSAPGDLHKLWVRATPPASAEYERAHASQRQ
jgi:3D-(3,5/4)-trihydroxycyclohexane-1,2-dione acylhydrolase (decyclizing)